MRLLLVSNGHGEDLSGALLAQALQQQGAEGGCNHQLLHGFLLRFAELYIA